MRRTHWVIEAEQALRRYRWVNFLRGLVLLSLLPWVLMLLAGAL